MTKFIRLTIILYIVVGLALLLGPTNLFPSFYKPNLMAVLAFVSAFLIWLPRVFFKTKDKKKKRAREALQLNIAVNVLINGAGGLGLYKLYLIGFEYDKLTHFITPLLLVVGFYYFLRAWYTLGHKEVLFFVAMGMFIAGIGWELLEYFSDLFFETQLLGGGSAQVFRDTFFDTIANILGITIAGIYLVFQNKKE